MEVTNEISNDETRKESTGIDPDSKIHGANVGPTWGQKDPGGPHVGHMNFAIWGYQKKVQTLRSW